MKNIDDCFINSRECDIYGLLQALTLDTICRVGMGVDFGVQKDVANSELLKQIRIMVSFPLGLMAVILRKSNSSHLGMLFGSSKIDLRKYPNLASVRSLLHGRRGNSLQAINAAK